MKSINEVVFGEATTLCYLIDRGKPAAVIPVKKAQVLDLEMKLKMQYELNYYSEKLCEDWVSFWIYKDKYLLEIIKSLPDKPKNVFDHWVLGKLFGYSDEAIRDFVTKD